MLDLDESVFQEQNSLAYFQPERQRGIKKFKNIDIWSWQIQINLWMDLIN
jgi:hypothetical protein